MMLLIAILFFIVCLIESLFNSNARENPLPYAYIKRSAKGRILGIDQGKAQTLVETDGMISGRNDTNLSTVLKLNRIAGTRDCVVLEFDTHELACNSFGFLLYEGILSDELFLVKLAEHSESGHNRRNLSAEFVSIERKTGFETQGVTAAESAWLDAAFY